MLGSVFCGYTNRTTSEITKINLVKDVSMNNFTKKSSVHVWIRLFREAIQVDQDCSVDTNFSWCRLTIDCNAGQTN